MARTKDFDEKEVLAKAICLFWRKGYHATSMQDVVDSLGISRSSLYDTYGDKHTLYLKALEAYQQAAADQVCGIITQAPTAKKAIGELLAFVVRDLLQDKERKGCFIVNAEVENARNDMDVKEIVCKNDQLIERAFLHAIKEGQKRGEISRGKSAVALARFMTNTVKGLQVTAKSSDDENLFNDIIRMALTILD